MEKKYAELRSGDHAHDSYDAETAEQIYAAGDVGRKLGLGWMKELMSVKDRLDPSLLAKMQENAELDTSVYLTVHANAVKLLLEALSYTMLMATPRTDDFSELDHYINSVKESLGHLLQDAYIASEAHVVADKLKSAVERFSAQKDAADKLNALVEKYSKTRH